MRFLFLIGIITLYVTNLDAQGDNIVFPTDDYDTLSMETSEKLPVYKASEAARETARKFVIYGVDTFGAKLFKAIGKDRSDDLIYSPISVSTVLSMISYDVPDLIAKKMNYVLRLPYGDTTKIGYQNLIDSLASYRQVELYLAQKIFYSVNIPPKPKLIETATEAFRSEVQALDFKNSESASKIINDWCEKKTKSRITDVVKSSDFSEDTTLVLVNAVYFKGTWTTQFDESLTMPRMFYLNDDQSRNVPTMYSLSNYNYGKLPEVDAEFLELPYMSEDWNHNISMFIIRPNTKIGITRLHNNIDNVILQKLTTNGQMTVVELQLPKFTIESELDLKEPLKEMGLTEIFDDSGSMNPSISKIVQKAFIKVDEKGAEAAAVTNGILQNRFGADEPEVKKFHVDRPFIAIIATRTKNPVNLFTLRYNGKNVE